MMNSKQLIRSSSIAFGSQYTESVKNENYCFFKMVKPTFEDFVFGFSVYIMLHPEFPLNPDDKPDECFNLNYLVDGCCENLISSVDLYCSMSSNANNDDEIDQAWQFVCSNANDIITNFNTTFLNRYKEVESFVNNPSFTKMMKTKALIVFQRMIVLRQKLNI